MRMYVLLTLAAALTFGPAAAQDGKPGRIKRAKKVFQHERRASAGPANKARFRRDNHPPVIDLHPNDPRRFAKVKAAKPYKYPQPKGAK